MPSAVAKSLSRLSREKLIDLCATWSKSSRCDPYLSSTRDRIEAEEADYLHDPAPSRQDLNALYDGLRDDTSNVGHLSKRDIIDRVVDGDWRRGLSYAQLASIDFANLEENDTALRWSALKLVPLDSCSGRTQRPDKRRKSEHVLSTIVAPRYPQIAPAIFAQNLRHHISPLIKGHYHIHRMEALQTSIVRLYLTPNTPFAPLSVNVPRQGKAAADSARTMFIALPDSCPYVYVSISGSTSPKTKAKVNSNKAGPRVDVAATKRIVLEAIPKALSRPQQRWSLETTRLTAKSLQAMTLLRGGGRVGTTGGVLCQLSQPKVMTDDTRAANEESPAQICDRASESHHNLVEQRFGSMEGLSHAKLDRVQVRVQNLVLTSSQKSKKRKRIDADKSEHEATPLTITLSGSDVFAGLKQFALLHPEYVDIERLPSVLTGEQSTTSLSL